MNFFNTTGLQGQALMDAIKRASNQDDRILLYYLNKREPFGPSQILAKMKMCGFNWPITSVRRSITTLCKKGHLLKTMKMVPGMFGEQEHTWVINAVKYPSKAAEQAKLFNDKAA